MSQTLRTLHGRDQPLLRLPNAWDAASARLFESLGASAIATTSAGVSWSQGHADGSAMPAEAVVAFSANLARVLTVPLSVDIEDGYSDDPARVAELVARLAGAGVAGINIEDGPRPVDVLVRKIARIREQAAKQGVDIFINARTDVFLAQLVDAPRRVEETIARGERYRAAGADGLFVPALIEPDEVKAVVDGVALPINVLAWQGLPDADELATLGVRRLSAGSGIPQVLWAQAEQLARRFLETGRSADLGGQIPYGRMQALFRSAGTA